MRINLLWISALSALLLGPAGAAAAGPRPGFFGVVPQGAPSDRDARWMSAGGVGAIRLPLAWSAVEPAPPGGPAAPGEPVSHHYDWTRFDRAVAIAVGHDLEVLPFLYHTPRWLGTTPQTLPTGDQSQRSAWTEFVRAAVRRYGPDGDFWFEHSPFSADPLPIRPISRWQVWNEENFFYFAYPVAPADYSLLLADAAAAIRTVDPDARVVLGGLYGRPHEGPPTAMRAAPYLQRLYAIPGSRESFDEVAVHPYAPRAAGMKRLVEAVRRVIADNHDDAGLLITEFGWGSQSGPRAVSFERGLGGQARQLRRAYRGLIAARRRLRLRRVYWFSWKDAGPPGCRICDSTGLFRRGEGFDAKPAWRAFTRFSGGYRYPH
jgi:hypothetical protein